MSLLSIAAEDLEEASVDYGPLELGVFSLHPQSNTNPDDSEDDPFLLVGVDIRQDELVQIVEDWEHMYTELQCTDTSRLDDADFVEVREYRPSN